MRTVSVLALVAALGFPLPTLAQAPGDEGSATAVSGVSVETRPVTPCAASGFYQPDALFDAPPDNTKTTRTEESPGTKAWIEKAAEKGGGALMTDPLKMGAGLRRGVERQSKRINENTRCLGALKSIKFLHVSAKGLDDYKVEFANGALEYAIAPLNAHGEAETLWLRAYTPQPASMRFNAFLRSLERRRPDYSDLKPDSAATVRAQWPALQKSLKDWGRLKGARFLRQEDDGSYVYLAAYDHRQVLWTARLPSADEKFTALTYDEKAE